MKNKKYVYIRYLLHESLTQLGFSIAASNVLGIQDLDLLKKYAQQIVSCSTKCWTTSRRDELLKKFKELKLLD